MVIARPESMLRSTLIPLEAPARPAPGGAPGVIVAALRWVGRLVIEIAWWARGLFRLIPVWRRLAFTMQAQQQTQWCWSAVATSVSHFYDASSTWTQCAPANAELGETTCCQDGSSAACNRSWYLDLALDEVGHLDAWSSGAASFAGVRAEIDGGEPLGVRIGWSGGGGHFLVIEGYLDDATDQVAVDDPWYGASDLAYSTLTTSYQGSGSWTHSYRTQP